MAYHLCLDEGLQGVDLAVMLALDELDLTKGTLSNDLESGIVLGTFAGTEETEEVCF